MSEKDVTNIQEDENGKGTVWARSVEHLLKKGRIAVWIILLGTFWLGAKEVLFKRNL